VADLTFTGGLDLSDALSSVDELSGQITAQLGDALTAVSAEFSAALVAAGGDALAEIAGTGAEIPITADVSAAEAEVTSLVGAVDAETPSITIDADTTEAQGALDELSSSVDDLGTNTTAAGGGVGGLTNHTSLLAGAAGLATGEVSGLKEASGALGGSAAVAAGGAFALAGGLGVLFKAGLDATSAEERFTAALGEQAAAVKKVEVGNLSTDLYTLGVRFGSTSAAMDNATAKVFQFAVNSGASREQARQFADGIAAVSARAVAMNPTVGTVADVMDRAAIGIGRARSAASLLNIGLSTTEVNTRAAAIATANGEASATAYDKSLAALQISVERFGPSLKQNIEVGADNAANKEKALKAEFDNFLESAGKPLVAPAFDAMRAAIPIGEDLATTLGDLGGVAIPVLAGALQVVGPLIGPIVVGFLAMKAAELAAAGISLLQGGLIGLTAILPIASAETRTMSAEMVASGEASNLALGPLGLIAIAAGVTALAINEFGNKFDSARLSTKGFGDQLTKTSDDMLIAAFDKKILDQQAALDHWGQSIDGTKLRLADFRAVAESNVGTAQRLIDAQGPLTPLGEKYAAILDQVVAKQKAQTTAQNESKAAGDTLTASVNPLAAAQQAYADATKGATTATDAFKTALEGLINVNGDVTAATIALGNANANTIGTLLKNGLTFDLNTQAGRDNTAALQSQVAAAEQLAVATEKQTGKTADGTAVMDTFTQTLINNLTNLGLDKGAVDAIIKSLGLVPPDTHFSVTGDTSQPQTLMDKLLADLRTFADTPWEATASIVAPVLPAALAQPQTSTGISPALGDYLRSLNPGTRAAGGPVVAGMPYLVNENTPRSEIFVPSQSGTIVPRAQWDAASGAGTADYSVHDNIIVAPSPTDVPRAIAQKQRAMQFLAGAR
jgi:hypothetical protein